MTVFETTQEEEIKILSPLFLISDSWLWALALYKPLDSSWRGAQFLRHEPTVVPSPPTESKCHLSVFSKLCLHIFLFGFGGQRRPRIWPATIGGVRIIMVHIGWVLLTTVWPHQLMKLDKYQPPHRICYSEQVSSRETLLLVYLSTGKLRVKKIVKCLL